MLLSLEGLEAFNNDVLSRAPNEACGLVIGGMYYPCTNIHEAPLEAFRISADERFMTEVKYGTAQAVLHSHPVSFARAKECRNNGYNPAWPSMADQQCFLSDLIPWGIAATDGTAVSGLTWLTTEIQPFERREFGWFVADCFTLVRDWYKLNWNVTIPNFPREWEFWKKGLNTIEDNIRSIPGVTIHPLEEAQYGDTAVMSLSGKVVEHLGIVSGPNELYHQFLDRYPIKRRLDQHKYSIRYVARVNKEAYGD